MVLRNRFCIPPMLAQSSAAVWLNAWNPPAVTPTSEHRGLTSGTLEPTQFTISPTINEIGPKETP